MTQSMTGFFAGDTVWNLISGKKIKIYMEIKSLNSRFFELSTKLPSALNSLELPLANLFKKRLFRGKIFFFVKILADEDNLEKPTLNVNLLEKYLKIEEKIKQTINQGTKLSSLAEWINLPKLLSFEIEALTQDDLSSFMELSEKWLEKLLQDRLREGMNTEEDLKNSIQKIHTFLSKISVENEKIQEEIKLKIEASRQTMNQMKESQEEHSLLLEQKKFGELEFALNKNDINEEVVRTKMHLETILSFFSSNSPEFGKKLEFTLQELVREINTISSKNNNFTINSNCVDIKVELEKMREQSQNVA